MFVLWALFNSWRGRYYDTDTCVKLSQAQQWKKRLFDNVKLPRVLMWVLIEQLTRKPCCAVHQVPTMKQTAVLWMSNEHVPAPQSLLNIILTWGKYGHVSELLPHFTSRVVRTRPWLFAAQTQITTGTLQVKGSRLALSVVLFILDLLLAVEVLSYGIGTAVGSSRALDCWLRCLYL